MARAPFAAVFVTLLTFAVDSCLSILHQNLTINTNNTPLILNRRLDTTTTTTMVMPLYFNDNNKFVNSASKRSRRHLQSRRRPNARMPLHDDLLINGYYTTRLWIGTPPQQFALIVDTGSTVTYVPCATCEQCGKHQDPKFQPEQSSTYQPVKCNIDCSCDNEREQCVYERQYAEMSSSSGVLGEDIVSFGNQSELPPQRAVFGCENMETGDLYSQHADGIMGLGHGDLSIVDQLVDKGVISDSFSLCYGGMDVGGGAMVLGGIIPPSDMVFARSDPDRSPYYNIDLKEIHVAGKALPLSHKVFDGKHGTVLDSGTTYAYLPESAFAAFKDAITKELHSLKQIKGPDPNYNDICFSGSSSDSSELSETFPYVDMVFSNGQKLSLSPENYLFRHSKVHGAYCLGIFQNGKDPTTLLGGIVVRNTLVTYDREHEKIGFWKTNCSELWERLHISTSTPTPPTGSNMTNSSADMAPRLAPSEPPQQNTQGAIKIGLITFDMSLSVKYSELKPHISELAEFISKELSINVSQVRIMNFTSKGNESLVRVAIFPAKPDDYIANATAMDIIAKLNESRVHLPDRFGSYKLLEWNIEPPPVRTWWQQHVVIIVSMSIAMIVLVLSAFGLWFLWRRRDQSLVSYKPVESAVPEQELQPI